ncbi:hypothetical protein [Eisenbergiella porci]|uniref:hypothetical protein n=1 Tax=Eisenbergiella porci TaxID=2652274 RepID=UPI0022E825DF|nr:hypothetical protein [Eisenbergiella porci]
MKIRIPKMSISIRYFEKPEGWIWCIIVFNCIYKALVNFLNMPSAINYLNDLFCLLLLYAMSISVQKHGIRNAKIPARIFLVLLIETVLSYMFNLYSPLVYIWGLRTLFRYFVFFFACTLFVKKDTIERILDFLYKILIVNLIFAILEYTMGYGLDAVTGLYSEGMHTAGGSAALNILMCIVCTHTVIQYYEKKVSLLKMLIPILASIYMSAIGEIKVFYFEIILIFTLCSLFTRFSWKKLVGIFCGVAVLVIGLGLYGHYYGDRGTFFSIESAMMYLGADGSTYGQAALNRTTALPYMWEHILTDPIKKIFGLGLGYADIVSFPAFSSGFAAKYSFLGYQYWFASLELTNIGLLGVVLLTIFYTNIFIYCSKRKKTDSENGGLYCLVQVVVCLTFVWFFYNQALIMDFAAFMLYWILAVPYILTNAEQAV